MTGLARAKLLKQSDLSDFPDLSAADLGTRGAVTFLIAEKQDDKFCIFLGDQDPVYLNLAQAKKTFPKLMEFINEQENIK